MRPLVCGPTPRHQVPNSSRSVKHSGSCSADWQQQAVKLTLTSWVLCLLQDAVLQLQAALSELSRVGSSSSQGRPSVQQVQGLGAELEPVTGLFTRFTGNVFTAGSIAALSLKPGAEGSFRPDLCVVVNYPSSRQLNLYAGCSKQQLRSITLTDKVSIVLSRWVSCRIFTVACWPFSLNSAQNNPDNSL